MNKKGGGAIIFKSPPRYRLFFLFGLAFGVIIFPKNIPIKYC